MIRPRRRHENDMDFAKFNPFYWQGRESYFKVEDYTNKGQKLIRFTLRTEWPQNYIPTRGPDFSAIYKGDPLAADETTRSKFAINARMDHKGEFKNFEANIAEGEFNVHADELKKDKMLMFEFRFFLDESNPDWIRQKQANNHNLSAYYSEFFRIKIGNPGLFIDDINDAKAIPVPQRHSGGWMTTATIKVEPWRALQQQSINLLADSSQTFLNGRTWFHTDMVDGIHKGDEADDKPSVFFPEDIAIRKGFAATAFNVRSCNSCHYNNGQFLLPAQGQPVVHTLVKTTDKSTGTESKVFGNQLQPDGDNGEGTIKVIKTETKVVKLNDGTEVTLKKNIFDIDTKLSKDNLGTSYRRPMALTGVGLLNNIPESTIRSLVGRQRGEVSLVNGKISRFGWKADQPKLIDQIAAALRNDLGVRNDIYTKTDCTNGCKDGKAQFPLKTMEEIETYISLLGVPPRTDPTNPKVLAGEMLFRGIGCAKCHVPTMTTGESK
ncbi:MAG: thiol oxidoreductase, partial [Proteobacteria bacterium]